MLITILRHGETTDNLKKKLSGKTDCKLTNWGYLQALLVGKRLKNDKFTHVYCSDLKRAKLTCKIILRQNIFTNLEAQKSIIQCDVRIREQNFGDLDGMEPLSEQVVKTRKELFENKSDEESFAIRYPNGESKLDVYQRVSEFWNDFYSNLDQSRIDEVHLLIVSHGLVVDQLVKVISHHFYGNREPSFLNNIKSFYSDNTGVWRLKIKSNKLELIMANSTDHYSELPLERKPTDSLIYNPNPEDGLNLIKVV